MIQKQDVLFIVFSVVSLLLIGIFLAVPATPSDPLQYIGPALSPENGFPFLDRIFLWLWIRLFNTFSISPEYVGAYATLAQVIITYSVSSLWLSHRYGSLSVILFSFLFFGSNAWLSIITYTYPMQGLTMFVVTSLVLFDLFKNREGFLALGAGFTLAIFSKIQGFAFVSGLAYSVYHSMKNKSFKPLIHWSYGFLIILIGLSIILYVDGNPLSAMVERYFQGSASAQFAGRGLGGMPNWHKLLEKPAYLLSFVGLVSVFFVKKNSPIFIFAFVGFSQLIFLLLIYVVTGRGGPVIENYVLDSFTLGAIVFSATVSSFLSRNANASILLMFLGVVIFISSLVQYTFTHIDLGIIVSFFISSLVVYLLLPYLKKKSSIFALYPLFLIFVYFLHYHGIKGIETTEGRIRWVGPYYYIANSLMGQDKKFVVDVDLGYGNTDAGQRIKMILSGLYQSSYSSKVCFDSCSEFNPDFLITNQMPSLTKYLPIIDDDEQNSKTNFIRRYDEINQDASLPFFNDGSRGDGLVNYDKSVNKFELIPSGLSTFTANFNRNNSIFNSPVRKNHILLKGDSSFKSNAMYLQYRLNNKYFRNYGSPINNVHFLLISIPLQASDISYGWHFEDFKQNMDFSRPVIYDANYSANSESIFILDLNNSLNPL